MEQPDLTVCYYYTTTVTQQEKTPYDLLRCFVVISILEVTVYVKLMWLSFSTDSGCSYDQGLVSGRVAKHKNEEREDWRRNNLHVVKVS